MIQSKEMEWIKSIAEVRAVFFDLYNTLARFYPPREEIQTQACREFGILVLSQGIAQGYARGDDFMARENAVLPVWNRSSEAQADFFAEYERLILQGAGVSVDKEMAGRIYQRLRQIPYDLVLFDDVIPTLTGLRASRRLTLGLISNLPQEGDALSRSLGLDGYLDFLVTSKDVGAEKPHPPIFIAALEKAGVKPHQAIHVGDQYQSDILGARAVGINPVLIDRYRTATIPVDCPVIHSLSELVSLLKAP